MTQPTLTHEVAGPHTRDEWIEQWITYLNSQIVSLTAKVQDMADEIDTLKSDYEANKAANAAFAKSLSDKLAALTAQINQQPATDPRITSLISEMEADTAAIVAQNAPATGGS